MTIGSYPLNSTVRMSAAFTVSGTATDPTTVSLVVKDPAGAETTYTYADSQVTKDSTGNYHYDLHCTTAGTWHYAFTGTGTVAAVSESYFFIAPTRA